MDEETLDFSLVCVGLAPSSYHLEDQHEEDKADYEGSRWDSIVEPSSESMDYHSQEEYVVEEVRVAEYFPLASADTRKAQNIN